MSDLDLAAREQLVRQMHTLENRIDRAEKSLPKLRQEHHQAAAQIAEIDGRLAPWMNEQPTRRKGAMPESKKQPLVVTTAHRGVFFGYAEPTTEKTIRLEKCRMAVYWSVGVRGVMGLAVTGPKG